MQLYFSVIDRALGKSITEYQSEIFVTRSPKHICYQPIPLETISLFRDIPPQGRTNMGCGGIHYRIDAGRYDVCIDVGCMGACVDVGCIDVVGCADGCVGVGDIDTCIDAGCIDVCIEVGWIDICSDG